MNYLLETLSEFITLGNLRMKPYVKKYWRSRAIAEGRTMKNLIGFELEKIAERDHLQKINYAEKQ